MTSKAGKRGVSSILLGSWVPQGGTIVQRIASTDMRPHSQLGHALQPIAEKVSQLLEDEMPDAYEAMAPVLESTQIEEDDRYSLLTPPLPVTHVCLTIVTHLLALASSVALALIRALHSHIVTATMQYKVVALSSLSASGKEEILSFMAALLMVMEKVLALASSSPFSVSHAINNAYAVQIFSYKCLLILVT